MTKKNPENVCFWHIIAFCPLYLEILLYLCEIKTAGKKTFKQRGVKFIPQLVLK